MRILLLSFILFISCQPQKKELTAQQIVDKSILASGTDKVSSSEITFEFRDKQYSAVRNNGKFKLIRAFDSIKDVLSNSGFERFINEKSIKVVDSMALKYSNSVNSVHYFSVLPYGLNDKAVRKKRLPSSMINGKEYYKIEITFSENGGGEDFEDVFIYWIGKEDYLIDYLAYSYHTNGGGKRFRVLKEECFKNGIRFVDYQNYKPNAENIKLIDIDKSYEKNNLKLVSEIILRNIEVSIIR